MPIYRPDFTIGARRITGKGFGLEVVTGIGISVALGISESEFGRPFAGIRTFGAGGKGRSLAGLSPGTGGPEVNPFASTSCVGALLQ